MKGWGIPFFTYKIGNDTLNFHLEEYEDPKPCRVAITAINKNGTPWGTLSTNLPEESACLPHQFFAKEWSENKYWVPIVLRAMENEQLIRCTGYTTCTGFITDVRQFEFINEDDYNLIFHSLKSSLIRSNSRHT